MKQLLNSMKKINITGCIEPAILIAVVTIFILTGGTLTAKDRNPVKIVTAKAGLNIRETPDTSGKKTGLIPMGEYVEITKTNPEVVTIAGKSGHWVKVEWESNYGWAFDAFLGDIPSSPLLDHFISIGLETHEGVPARFYKEPGEIKVYGGASGNSEGSIEPGDKPARQKGDSIIFEYYSLEYIGYDDDSNPEGGHTESTCFECAIDGKKILSTKKGETLTTEVKCREVKKEDSK